MASYRTLPSGKVQACVKHRGRSWYRTGPTKASVKRWADQLERDLAAGLDPDRHSTMPTVREWHDRWWAARVAEPTTLAGDEARLRTHVLPRWGDVPLDEVSPMEVQGWVRLLSKQRAADTVRKVHSLLSQMCDDAVKERLIVVSPCAHTDLPTVPPGRELWLTEEQVAAIADAALNLARSADATPPPPRGLSADHPAACASHSTTVGTDSRTGCISQDSAAQGYALIWTLYLTGARWGEATGLRVQDLDFLRRRIRIGQVNTRSGLKAYPKGRRNRTVPMPVQLSEVLAAHLERTPPASRSSLVFASTTGGPVSDANFRHRVWKPAVEAAGLAELNPRIHDLRHSCASRLVQAGVPMSEIAAHLGHGSIRTSERYSHLGERRHDAVLTALERGTLDASSERKDTRRG